MEAVSCALLYCYTGRLRFSAAANLRSCAGSGGAAFGGAAASAEEAAALRHGPELL
eukprot:SAG11_NODE_24760_length_368_cov_1.148699_1_plen_55_part_01